MIYSHLKMQKKKKTTKRYSRSFVNIAALKNIVYERHKFWSRSQHEGEPFDKWLKEMRVIAKDCEFAEEDNMIRDKIVFGVYDKKVQERMLRNSNLSLKDAIDLCRLPVSAC